MLYVCHLICMINYFHRNEKKNHSPSVPEINPQSSKVNTMSLIQISILWKCLFVSHIFEPVLFPNHFLYGVNRKKELNFVFCFFSKYCLLFFDDKFQCFRICSAALTLFRYFSVLSYICPHFFSTNIFTISVEYTQLV